MVHVQFSETQDSKPKYDQNSTLLVKIFLTKTDFQYFKTLATKFGVDIKDYIESLIESVSYTYLTK